VCVYICVCVDIYLCMYLHYTGCLCVTVYAFVYVRDRIVCDASSDDPEVACAYICVCVDIYLCVCVDVYSRFYRIHTHMCIPLRTTSCIMYCIIQEFVRNCIHFGVCP